MVGGVLRFECELLLVVGVDEVWCVLFVLVFVCGSVVGYEGMVVFEEVDEEVWIVMLCL